MGNIAQLQVRKASDVIGRVGQVISQPHNTKTENLPHTAGRAKQVYTLTVPVSPTATTLYSITALGETASFEATGVRADDIAGLAAAVNANPILRGVFVVSTSGTAVILTARQYGNDITATADDESVGEITFVETTSPAASTQINVGRAVFLDADKRATATVPATLANFRGAAKFMYASEQSAVGANDSDLFGDREDVEIMRNGLMIVETGSDAVKGGAIFIGTDGKFYADGNGTSTSTEFTPSAVNSAAYTISATIDGDVYNVTYVSGGTATVQAIVEGLKAQIDVIIPAGVATASEDNLTLTLDITDPNSTYSFAASANLAGVTTTDATRLKLSDAKGEWFGANIIELKGA